MGRFTESFNDPDWIPNDGKVVIRTRKSGPSQPSLACLGCNKTIQRVKSSYGIITLGYFRKTVDLNDGDIVILEFDGQEVLATDRRIIQIPRKKKGFCCDDCASALYAQKYENKAGIVTRAFEYCDEPGLKSLPAHADHDKLGFGQSNAVYNDNRDLKDSSWMSSNRNRSGKTIKE